MKWKSYFESMTLMMMITTMVEKLKKLLTFKILNRYSCWVVYFLSQLWSKNNLAKPGGETIKLLILKLLSGKKLQFGTSYIH